MALVPRLELRQSQSLVMTPQLQQAIKLLQMSNMELSEYVEEELEKNPLLERSEDQLEGADGEPAGGLSEGSLLDERPIRESADGLADLQFNADGAAPAAGADALDVEDGDQWDGDGGDGGDDSRYDGAGLSLGSGSDHGGGSSESGSFGLEQTLSEETTLRDHLTRQLQMDVSDPHDRLIGLHLIDMLDEAGYLDGDLVQISELLGCDVERVEATLVVLQQFDPPGVFARTLAECLMLQLRDRNRLDPAMQVLLDNLDLLGKRDVSALVKLCGVDADDIADMLTEIRALDPKPGLVMEHGVAQPVTPDIFMWPKGGGGWAVELNNDTLPRVLVNNHYFADISRGARKKEDKRYINECFQSANWLVKSLHQRATTILKVATEIVRQQEAFFSHGVKFLKPMILRDIATEIEMHESTVSRVTSNKYMATPRGIYELKYFFTPAIGNNLGGASHSAESVRYSIKALIDGEAADNVLSDDKIVEILKLEGIDVARRTVAKYREAMHIASSVQRRREKAAQF
jgi:RNA polymerase sigma-54 factor